MRGVLLPNQRRCDGPGYLPQAPPPHTSTTTQPHLPHLASHLAMAVMSLVLSLVLSLFVQTGPPSIPRLLPLPPPTSPTLLRSLPLLTLPVTTTLVAWVSLRGQRTQTSTTRTSLQGVDDELPNTTRILVPAWSRSPAPVHLALALSAPRPRCGRDVRMPTMPTLTD